MDYSVQTYSLTALRSDCLISGVFAGNKMTPSTQRLDKASGGQLARLLKSANLNKPGDTLLLHELPGIKTAKVLLVGLGPKKEYKASAYRKAVSAASNLLQADKSRKLTATLANDTWKGGDHYSAARDAVLACEEAIYRADTCKSDKARQKAAPKHPLEKLALWADKTGNKRAMAQGVGHGRAIATGARTAKELANLPGNICTPGYLAEQAAQLGKKSKKLNVSVLDEEQMQELGMGALLSVSRGSRQPAKLIIMEYDGQGRASAGGGRKPGAAKGNQEAEKPIILVGKGLTFDAGGISLKPGAGMDEMKYDMCGGASVIGALQACTELALPINVIGLVPASENLPDGNANKPGDIVTSMSGQTIEILNTDAEGRLILCDALTYAKQFDPAAVIDIATLTGACIIALGSQASGLMANNQKLADELLDAGQNTNDRAWQLPLWDEYQQQLDSPFADLANIGGRPAGTITAGCFLSRFTDKFKWAHLDIAGTAWKSGNEKGATGRPVPLLVQFLLNRCGMR